MRSVWRPYTQELTAAPSLRLEYASGAYLYTKSGQKVFDAISSWWLITHGHCHPAIADAIAKQASHLDQVTFANFTHEPAEELVEELIRLMPKALSKLFFSDNGSTAVEVALKMAIQSCAQKGQDERSKFIAFESSYHGDTVGAMSVSALSAFNKPYQKTLFEVFRAKHPKMSTAPIEEWTSDFKELLETHHHELAGVIIEPLLQGAGGMIVWPHEAVCEIVKLCRDYGVFVIFDEVMTGFGRTGAMFAMDTLNVVPDFLCLSKGITGGSLPLAVTITTDSVFDLFRSNDRSKMFFHGHSFTGNPISCAAALANIRVFKSENTLQKIGKISLNQAESLKRLSNTIEISDPRVCGTIAAFDIGHDDYLRTRNEISAAAMKGGIFLRTLGNTVYVMPPYCSTSEDLKTSWEVIEAAIRKV